MVPGQPAIFQAVVRLVPSGEGPGVAHRPRCYRPLVIGPAILHRPLAGTEPWTVDVSDDGRLLPVAPRSAESLQESVAGLREGGRLCRVATALFCTGDVSWPWSDRPALRPARPGVRAEFYGWSLMVQPPGVHGRAFVDGDEANPELPACFELPLELVDRMTFLESRGWRTRPIALITRPEDFEPVGCRWRNRFRPAAACGRPCRLDRLL